MERAFEAVDGGILWCRARDENFVTSDCDGWRVRGGAGDSQLERIGRVIGGRDRVEVRCCSGVVDEGRCAGNGSRANEGVTRNIRPNKLVDGGEVASFTQAVNLGNIRSVVFPALAFGCGKSSEHI